MVEHQNARPDPWHVYGTSANFQPLSFIVDRRIMCADALSKLAVRRVVFGCYNGKFGGCGSILSMHKRSYSVTSGVLNDEAINLFKAFYARENDRAPDAKRKLKDGSLSHIHRDVQT